MTKLVKSKVGNGHYVAMTVKHIYTYVYQVIEVYLLSIDDIGGYPIYCKSYAADHKKNANATYYRYVKKYCNN